MAAEFLQSLPMSDYMQARRDQGQLLTPGEGGTFWRTYSKRVVARFPDLTLTVPEDTEIHHALKKHRCYVASYNREQDAVHPANGVLYLCTNRAYTIEQLGGNARRDVRRALRTCQIEPIEPALILEEGANVFRETRERFGFTDGTMEHFQQRVGHFLQNPAHHIVAARCDNKTIAFATVRAVDDWAEIEGMFSSNEGREHCPNNGIVHYILEMFLRNRECRSVSYGFSSIQEQSHTGSLHQFKLKVGFEALPVHRAFVVHPFLRPLVHPASAKVLKACLQRNPNNRWLRLASGMLSQMTNSSGGISVEQANELP